MSNNYPIALIMTIQGTDSDGYTKSAVIQTLHFGSEYQAREAAREWLRVGPDRDVVIIDTRCHQPAHEEENTDD